MSRNEQFMKWADAVINELVVEQEKAVYDDVFVPDPEGKAWKAKIRLMLAQRAYDLVTYAIETADYDGIKGWIQGANIPLYHKVVQSVPDMPVLPEEQVDEPYHRKR